MIRFSRWEQDRMLTWVRRAYERELQDEIRDTSDNDFYLVEKINAVIEASVEGKLK